MDVCKIKNSLHSLHKYSFNTFEIMLILTTMHKFYQIFHSNEL